MELLEFAINMEREGEQYYREQAEIHAQDGLKPVFDMLAREEKEHAVILENKAKGLAASLVEPVREDWQSVFSAAPKSDSAQDKAEQIDAYRLALEKEQQSIDLYRKLSEESKGDSALFQFLIRQEEIHYQILEDVIKLVNRPNNWVESAEFGVREEY